MILSRLKSKPAYIVMGSIGILAVAGFILTGTLMKTRADPAADHGQVPVAAGDFLNSLGINTHVNFTGSNFSAYRDLGRVKAALTYLGVRHIRDSGFGEQETARLAEVARDANVKIDFALGSGGEPDFDKIQSNLHNLLAAAPGSLSAVEGFNEINNLFMANNWQVTYRGQTTNMCDRDYKAAIDAQSHLYAMIKADPLLKDIPVYNFSVVYLNMRNPVNGCFADYAADIQGIGTLPVISDFDNLHDYPFQGAAPRASYAAAFGRPRTQPAQPIVLTETGYSTGEAKTAKPSLAINETTQARYVLSAVFDAYSLGAQRTFLYELMDNNPDDPATSLEHHYGLISATGAPKPAGKALHNLTTILADTGAVPSLQPLKYNLTLEGAAPVGAPMINHMLLQKSDGTYYLALWAEPRLWNPFIRADATRTTPQRVTVTLAETYKAVAIFDPLQQSSPISTKTHTSTVTVDVVDHPILIGLH